MSVPPKKVGIIGVGKLGGSLAARLSASPDFDLVVSDANEEGVKRLVQGYGVGAASSNTEAAEASDLLIVAVKPWDVLTVLDEVAPAFDETERAVVSVAAGVPIKAIEGRLPAGAAVLRVMPNVAASVGLGSAVVAANGPGEGHVPSVMQVFGYVGDVMELAEGLFDAATALHGSGPAYVALFADALIHAGVREGIPREVARRLVVGTLRGTSVMLEERSAHAVRDEVTTPGGTTAAALAAMEKAGFVAAVYDGVEAATQRSRRLAQ